MKKVITSFFFEHIPINVDKSSIHVFQHAKEVYSLEYAIFDPNIVRIMMHPVARGHSDKKGSNRGIAKIQQFALAMGLHQNFHKIRPSHYHKVFDFLSSTFRIGSEGEKFCCGGFQGIKGTKEEKKVSNDGFIDEILEILTLKPQFAFVQFVFKAIKLPKRLHIKSKQDNPMTQVQFDIQQGNVEYSFQSSEKTFMEELGCFEFSPRILIVETSPETLKSKIDRVSVLFKSEGFKVQYYPTFWRRFSHFKSLCLKQKIVSPVVLDGSSLMNLIAPPQRQTFYEGYTFVPNKSNYVLSKGINHDST